jgi:hypothetical protein
MNFRIRNPDGDDYTERQKTYYRHLEQFEKSSNTNLWKFFGWDFFHDGHIESIQVQGDLRTVAIKLNCPNVKQFRSETDYEYINVGFGCTFRNVTSLTIQDEKLGHTGGVYKYDAWFLEAEINTSPLLDGLTPQDEDDPDARYSLLIRLLADDSTVWLEMIFSQVDVVADEPTAFALMEADPRFHVPTWSEERMSG